jgi:heptosyltransferase I
MNILIVKTSSMGDIIHTLPALTDAGKIFPDIKFDWVVEESFAEIPKWHNLVDQVIPVSIRRWRKSLPSALKNKEWQPFYQALTAKSYDLVIDAQSLIKSAIITRLAHGKRYGLDKKSAREPLASLLYQHKIFIPKDQHAITRIRQLFSQALDYDLPTTEPDSSINLDFTASTSNNNLIFFHGTTRDDKCWPESNWTSLAKLAAQKNYIVQLPWSNEQEYKRVNSIADRCDNVKILPKSNLTTLAKTMKEARGIVAVDTGLGHLAAALQIPMVSLYGPTDPKLIGTYSSIAIHLKSETNTLLYNIPVSTVWKALQQQMEKSG